MSGVILSAEEIRPRLDEILAGYPAAESSLVQVLQDVMREWGFLPEPALERIALKLKVRLAKVYGVATFYKAFSLVPRGRCAVKICTGTACHVRGAENLRDEATRLLGVPAGESTPDLSHSLETVNCVGACGMAPVVVIDEKYHRQVKIEQMKELLGLAPAATAEEADEEAPAPTGEAR
ncbi:MAG: NAD(P)H-dependent oxidoreductase subunit E [Myxococcota bacterium]|nr:NAD(P)H-dependent oxidoreductase subunit E [Myxococcota bacterium]